MIANQSIQYMRRMNIAEGKKSATIEDLMSFLDALIMSQHGNFLITGLRTSPTVLQFRNLLDLTDPPLRKNRGFLGLSPNPITYYTLNANNRTLNLD